MEQLATRQQAAASLSLDEKEREREREREIVSVVCVPFSACSATTYCIAPL